MIGEWTERRSLPTFISSMNVRTFSSSNSEGSGRRITRIGTLCTGASASRAKMEDVAWGAVLEDGWSSGGRQLAPCSAVLLILILESRTMLLRCHVMCDKSTQPVFNCIAE